MTNVLRRAIDEIAMLPEADQEEIGRELLAYVEKLRALRAELEVGIASLDAGKGRAVDIADLLRRARAQHGET